MERMERTPAEALTRRRFLGLAGLSAGAVVLSGCGLLPAGSDLPRTPRAPETSRVREFDLETSPVEFALGGRALETWGYNDQVPGPEIRLTEGDTLRVKVRNRLPADTTIHWHGLPVKNSMDGVPGITQPSIKPDEDFVYEFAVPSAGTYLYHSHVGLQLDRGLYGPVIVEPKKEELSYDREYVLQLDDWLDGVSGTPEDTLEELQSGGGTMGGMGGMGGEAGDVAYPAYLINGRPPEDPGTLRVRRGDRVRLRLINPSADTVFRFAVSGHRLSVTHTDGQPVEPVAVDSVRLGMGERYDVILEADNPGVHQVVAVPEGKEGPARALLRYEESAGTTPPPADLLPKEVGGRLLTYADLRDAGGRSFPEGTFLGGPDRVHELTLSGGHGEYLWAINGQLYPDADPLQVREGEWVRLILQNQSMTAHPMHLHGHFFQVRNGTGRGPFKDTALVEAHMGSLVLDFVADNPGEWLFHCHNAYHMETGMIRRISYGG